MTSSAWLLQSDLKTTTFNVYLIRLFLLLSSVITPNENLSIPML